MKKEISILGTLIMFYASCNSVPLKTVKSVDLPRYMGKWYEIASFPNRFQKGCNCTTAEYELTDENYVKVTNTCKKDSTGGKISRVVGKAFVVEGSNNAKLKVQFFWPFKGDYYIIDLSPNYAYAAVGNPGRKYLWILSRTPFMPDSEYNSIINRVKEKGFEIKKLVKTNQNCDQ